MSELDDDNPFVAAMPMAVKAALLAQDVQALDLALRQMPRDEAEEIMRGLMQAGILVQRNEEALEDEQGQAYRALEPHPSDWPPAVAKALATGNIDRIYEALAELMPEEADRLYLQLKDQGLL